MAWYMGGSYNDDTIRVRDIAEILAEFCCAINERRALLWLPEIEWEGTNDIPGITRPTAEDFFTLVIGDTTNIPYPGTPPWPTKRNYGLHYILRKMYSSIPIYGVQNSMIARFCHPGTYELINDIDEIIPLAGYGDEWLVPATADGTVRHTDYRIYDQIRLVLEYLTHVRMQMKSYVGHKDFGMTGYRYWRGYNNKTTSALAWDELLRYLAYPPNRVVAYDNWYSLTNGTDYPCLSGICRLISYRDGTDYGAFYFVKDIKTTYYFPDVPGELVVGMLRFDAINDHINSQTFHVDQPQFNPLTVTDNYDNSYSCNNSTFGVDQRFDIDMSEETFFDSSPATITHTIATPGSPPVANWPDWNYGPGWQGSGIGLFGGKAGYPHFDHGLYVRRLRVPDELTYG